MTTDNQEKLRSAFFDEADIIFSLFDKDLNFVDVNEAFLKPLHFKRDDIIGKNITEISPDIKSSGRFNIYKEVIRTGKTIVIDEVKPHPSLGNFYARVKAFKVGDGLGIVTKNITDLKEAIEELETFIYKSTHDMRSPIASILGLTNIADEQVKDLDEAKHFCKIVKQQTERLDNILLVLFETMKIRKGEKTIHLINFNELIDGVKNSLAFINGFNEITIEKNITSTQKFYSDKILLISIFQNLVDNAIKYRKQNNNNSFIKISVSDENDGVTIKVADNGIGIADNLQKDVYKMFFRATNQASGSGLGLYTINHTIKKLGGTIKLDSKYKVGTTFTIHLPNEKVNGQQTK